MRTVIFCGLLIIASAIAQSDGYRLNSDLFGSHVGTGVVLVYAIVLDIAHFILSSIKD